jgi:8-oxo-dGTP diphosphatase
MRALSFYGLQTVLHTYSCSINVKADPADAQFRQYLRFDRIVHVKPETPLHSVSVAGVVIDDESRILVVKRQDNGAWQIPGGILERAETLEHGVRREVREETGIDIEVQQLSGVYKNLTLSVVALVYRCAPIGGTLTTSDESAEVAWWSIEQVRANFAPVFVIRVFDALAGRAFSRNHDGKQMLED